MKYRLLGTSGLRVSDAALGTMTFGEEWGWGAAKDEARKLYDTYREAGGNFIDTANVYTNGSSERFVGEFIKDHRQSIVLATKYSNAAPGNDPNAAGNHRKSMMQAVDASLSRLQTDYIDLYWVHICNQMTRSEVMRGLDDRSSGKILYAGISMLRRGGLRRRIRSRVRGWSRFSGLDRIQSHSTDGRASLSHGEGSRFRRNALVSLANGVLTGKYHGNGNAEAGRMSRQEMREFLRKSGQGSLPR